MYKFNFKEKDYELTTENCEYFLNDEESEVKGIDLGKILELLSQCENVDFSQEYYDVPCESCKTGTEEKAKQFDFLEYHFYIFTKDGNYVSSSISKDYEANSYGKLVRLGKFNNSYIVSVIVCKYCGSYSIEIEQCEM